VSFGGVNGAGPQGTPIFGNQGPASAPVAAGAVQGQAGAPANGATPFFGASFESIMAALSRGEVPANLGVTAPALGGQVPLLQAISQGVPQNAANGIGVGSGPAGGAGQGPGIVGSISGNGGATGTTFGGVQAVDAKQVSSVPTFSNVYSGN
jgi:hypothetical protein